METLLQDMRFGIRRLLKSPGFTIVALLSLVLGIGANAAIFSLVNTVLLRPLPVEKPEQLIAVYGTMHKGADFNLTSYPNYKDFRDRNDVFSGLLAYRFAPMSLSHEGKGERVWGYIVSGNYFDVLGVKPMLGRAFSPEEDRTPGANPVAVMSDNCWQRRFASDSSIIGQTVLLNDHKFTIIGVAPKEFTGTEVAFAPELYVPAMMQAQIEPDNNWLNARGDDNLFLIGRLKPNVTKAQAVAAMQSIALQLAAEYPDINEGKGVMFEPPGLFIPDIRGAVIGFAGALMAVVGLVLLIACVNLANLLLARATGRRKEIAIRLALGASRFRLIRQLLTESLLLSMVGGALGLLFALWINDLVSSLKLPTDIAIVFDLRIDWRVTVFTLSLSILTGIVFGLLPALQTSKPELVPALKDENALSGFRRSRLRNALVVAQIALSLLLLIGAGLIVRSLQKAQSIKPGFNPENAVMMSFDVGLQGYDETKGREFQRRVVERVAELPGVQAVTLTDNVPLSLNYNNTSIYIEGQPFVRGGGNLPNVATAIIGLDYFQAMGIGLRGGRDFTAQDDKKESRVAVVNETFARRFFSGSDALGKRFNFGSPDDPYWTIIGIAADGKYNSLGEDPKPLVYRPLLRNYKSGVSLVARTKANPQAMIAAMRREVQNLDPNLPLYNVQTLTEHMSVPLFPARMAAIVLGSFGVLALLLAAIGIYGVMAYSVAQRTREIGIRLALGAEPRDVLKLIVGQGMILAFVGIGVGLMAAFALTRVIKTLLYNVSATDPLTFAGVPLLLLTCALLACYIPAQRAMKVDPMIALRYE
ncbi:MAG: ABC transporter permease [Pyrinomonadaceae bacterium]